MDENKVSYTANERDVSIEQIALSGKSIVADVSIDLDANGVPQTCYFIVEAAPPVPPDLLAQADLDILDLTEQLILAKEGL